MPQPFPHEYKLDLRQIDGPIAILNGESEPELKGGPPIQFDGPGGVWSPEALLLGAVELCFLTTLSSLSRRQGVPFSDFSSTVRGYLEKNASGIVFSRIDLAVSLKGKPQDIGKLEALLQSAKKYCIISNALKVEVALQVNLTEEAST